MAHFLDTNIFLRFLTADDRVKAAACRELVQKAVDGEIELRTHPLILAEVVWVLESQYDLSRARISGMLNLLMNTPNLDIVEAEIFYDAMEIYAGSKLDLADCFAAALSLAEGDTMVSYDRDFDAIDGVSRREPAQIV